MKLFALFDQQSQHVDGNVAVAHDDWAGAKAWQKRFFVRVVVQESSDLSGAVDVIQRIPRYAQFPIAIQARRNHHDVVSGA